MSNKSVLHISTTLERGGAENQLIILAREQISLGMEVAIIGIKGKPELDETLSNLGVKLINPGKKRSLFNIVIFLSRFLAKNSNIVVHAHLPRAEIVARLALIGKENRLVVSRHNAEPFFPKGPTTISRLLSIWVTKRASAVIAISNAVQFFLRENNEIFDPNRIHVVHYAFDSKFVKDFDYKLHRESTDFLRFITIGRLTHQKNYPFMFQALSKISPEDLKFTLTILGSGELEDSLKALARTLNIENRISWLGKRTEVSEILRQHDAFIFTSRYEGFGLVLLEAIQHALPVIAPRNTAIPEVLGENYGGLYSDGNEQEFISLLTKLRDIDFYSNLSKASHVRSALFSPIYMVSAINSTYG